MIGNASKSGDLIWSGRVNWTHNEDSMESIDVPMLPVADSTRLMLTIRNSSPTVAVTANVGSLVKCYPAGTDSSNVWTAAGVAATDVFTSVAHGLRVGDAVELLTVGGSGGSTGVTYYVVGVDHETDVTADTFCLSTSQGGESLLNCDATTAFTFRIVAEFAALTTVTVAVWAAGTTTAPIAGVTSTLIEGWPFATGGGRIMVEKAAATAGVMSVYMEIRRA
jgi:hypothetical protein